MTRTMIAIAILAVVPSFGQTAAELLQKGIYAQETEGKLDDAIQIYRQIVNSAPNPREIGAQAQYRLAQALLQKGDTNGAAQEFSRLARDYSEYSGVISQLARQQPRNTFYFRVSDGQGGPASGTPLAILTGRGPSPEVPNNAEFDQTKHVTLTRRISQVEWINPAAWLKLEPATGDGTSYSVKLVSPNQLVGMGLTRATLAPGMEVTIDGVLAKDGSATVLAHKITWGNGYAVFKASDAPPGPVQ
jgi:tetratricopeptide (TPR) repeat protein